MSVRPKGLIRCFIRSIVHVRLVRIRLNPFPTEEPTAPPKGLFAFCWHYTRPTAPWLALLGLCSMLIAFGEVFLYQFPRQYRGLAVDG